MTIKSDAYALCKSAWESPLRDAVRSLVATLNKGQLGYVGRHHHAQALGYLVVDQKRSELEKLGLPIEPIGKDEILLLSSLHKQLVELNERCLEAIRAKVPRCARAMDPYNRFDYKLPEAVHAQNFLHGDAVSALAYSFSKHPAIDIAATIATLPQQTSEEKYIQAVVNFDMSIMKAGVFKSPDDFDAILYGQGKDSPIRIATRQLVALTCIRASLSTLDQLVYQAILSDKLPLLDNENIIEIDSLISNFVSRGLGVTYQPSGQALFLEVCDLVLAKLASAGIPSAQIWRVEAVHMEFSQESGTSVEVRLREVDDNLNPYGALLQHI